MDLMPRRFFTNDFFDDFMFSKENNMKCDIYEKDGMYNIEVDIPGFSKEEIKIEVNNDSLSIIAEKNRETDDEKNKNYIHRERAYGKYERNFYLRDIDIENINAEFVSGVLKITAAKKQEYDNKKYIDIK